MISVTLETEAGGSQSESLYVHPTYLNKNLFQNKIRDDYRCISVVELLSRAPRSWVQILTKEKSENVFVKNEVRVCGIPLTFPLLR